jgi:hypothetical protein
LNLKTILKIKYPEEDKNFDEKRNDSPNLVAVPPAKK